MRLTLGVCALLFTLPLAAPAHAQNSWPTACGNPSVQFKVKTDKKTTPLAPPATGQAQIVFIETVDGDFVTLPTTRFATDGAWAGATKGPSFFAISIAPGQHTVCAVRQSSTKEDLESAGVVTLNAEPGKTYFYEFKIIRTEVGSPELIGGATPANITNHNMATRAKPTVDSVAFSHLEEDQARNLLRKSALSTSTTKP